MSINGEHPVNLGRVPTDFPAQLGEQTSIHDVRMIGEHYGANMHLFDNAVNPPSHYPYDSVDMIANVDGRITRLFVHQNFSPDLQEGGESVLNRADLGYFPVVHRGRAFTIRRLPLVTMPLLSHDLRQTTAADVSRYYLAPVIRQLFVSAGVIPTRETLANLTHVEDLQQDANANQSLELGARFIPPYAFEEIQEAELVQKVLENAVDYGRRVVTELEKALAHA